ncbi:arylsulfatase I-like [Thunnus albacares]|uniref:arylsulfatase I-like n=1 Tax=Thunnus maccoyii TaxID=8240 RepID=UPI001C4B2DB6|nr:arylsulfatase I-like [Thunnus maccoyii]XP_042283647.1 arylsulfatase I-like [Thunnus maccoyii]XP_044224835.1 arylsulfatase I-like [Thunnus albacares]
MQAAAVALTVLSAVFSLDCLSAHWSKPNQIQHQSDGNTQNDETAPKQKNQPHIIFILTDDQGFNDIGYHNPSIKTPTLDKLAAEGVKLENYYVQPICTPSRSQLITGRYQIHTGLQHSIIRPSQPSCLPSHMDTLPERLREAGYTTHMVGKWHLGFYRKACLPTRKGFDSFFGSLTGSVDYYSYGSCDGPGLCGYDLHDDEGVAWGQEGKYSTALFTQRARKILESYDPTEKPLFLLLSLQAVHTPLQPPKSYIYPYRDMANVARRKFAAMVSTVDEAVRNITYALRKYGYYRNSVIIYSTDNGAQPFTGGSNWPLRGRKGTYWEGGVRGVAFVHSPLLKRRRRVSKDLLHITDWFPTLVGLAGGNISQSQGLDGFDVWPTLSEGRESPRQEILHNIDPLHKPPAPTMTWDATSAEGVSVSTSKGPAFKKPKKKKKKVLKQQPKQKSGFKLKTTKKPQTFSHHAAKPKPKLKSKPIPKLKHKSLPKSKLKPKPKTKVLVKQSSYKPRLKVHSSGTPYGHQNPSVSGTSRPKSQRDIQSHFKSKSWQTISQNQKLSQSAPPQLKSKTQLKLHLKSKSRRTLSQYQNMSQPETTLPPTHPTPELKFQPSQPVWDTSVQAAIRVGDWKLLTGDPGHGDWVPPQILPTLPGRWWNLERGFSTFYKSSIHKNVWLFNITGDPYERQDLADQRPDVVQRLLARLAYYNQTAVPVYFPPDDPRANPSEHGGAWVPWVDEEEDEEGKYNGVYKKGKNNKKKRKKKKCRLCKLKSFFLKLNTRMMSNRI